MIYSLKWLIKYTFLHDKLSTTVEEIMYNVLLFSSKLLFFQCLQILKITASDISFTYHTVLYILMACETLYFLQDFN